jgi:exodeoxyribonuclease VII small subunit
MAGAKRKQESADGASFEERLAALEAVVKELEGESLTLEASLGRYREGVEHLRACRAMLDDAERRLVELVADPSAEGGASERPLKVTERGLEPDAGDDAFRGS